jgi:hypothetical protein
MIEKALQLRAYLLKNPEMVVDSPTLKQMFMWLMDNYVVDSARASAELKEAVQSQPAAAPDQITEVVTKGE